MKIAAIADLHITHRDTPEWRILMDFLHTAKDRQADTLLLLGDIFDLLVGGHSYYYLQYAPFFDQLAALAAEGVSIHYIEGNHDFAFEHLFKGIPNIKVHRHGFYLFDSHRKIYCGHGDEIDPDNISYRLYTLFIRSNFMRWLINSAPSSWIDFIGRRSSRYSRAKGKRHVQIVGAHDYIAAFQRLVENFSAERSLDIMLCGHSHFHYDGLVGRTHYLNPGRAGHTRQYIWLDEAGARLETLP